MTVSNKPTRKCCIAFTSFAAGIMKTIALCALSACASQPRTHWHASLEITVYPRNGKPYTLETLEAEGPMTRYEEMSTADLEILLREIEFTDTSLASAIKIVLETRKVKGCQTNE